MFTKFVVTEDNRTMRAYKLSDITCLSHTWETTTHILAIELVVIWAPVNNFGILAIKCGH